LVCRLCQLVAGFILLGWLTWLQPFRASPCLDEVVETRRLPPTTLTRPPVFIYTIQHPPPLYSSVRKVNIVLCELLPFFLNTIENLRISPNIQTYDYRLLLHFEYVAIRLGLRSSSQSPKSECIFIAVRRSPRTSSTAASCRLEGRADHRQTIVNTLDSGIVHCVFGTSPFVFPCSSCVR